jgi:hypothetical protein
MALDALNSLMGSDVKDGKASNPVSGDAFAKLIQHIITNGPMGYSNAMRQNLGINTQQGGLLPTSGMASLGANAGTPYWYQPKAPTADPVQQLLGVTSLPEAPVTPTTPVTPAPVTPTRPGYQAPNIRNPGREGAGR